jgi:hypothetical protein
MTIFLKQENHLIVWPVLKELAEGDMLLTHIGTRARFDMSTKELLEACLDSWELPKDKNYRLILVRGDGKSELTLDNQTIKEAGIRNGDYFEIVSV